MTEHPFEQPQSIEALQNPYRDSVLAKADSAWGSNVGDQGYADPYEVAARLYESLYLPGQVVSGMDERAQTRHPDSTERDLPSQKLRATTQAILTEPLELAGQVPAVEEFVSVVAAAILHGADVAATVLPGAREQIEALMDNGDRPVMWSAGHPEHQHRKLGKTGLYNAVAIEGMEPPVEVTRERGEPLEIPTVVAADKTTPEIFARIREIAGQDQVVVVDDRVKNLRKFTQGIPGTKAAIWVQYGAHAEKEIAKMARGENPQLAEDIASGRIIPIKSIGQLTAVVRELRDRGVLTEERAAIFLDYDDTIGDNTQRRDMELSAVVDAIFAHGWA